MLPLLLAQGVVSQPQQQQPLWYVALVFAVMFIVWLWMIRTAMRGDTDAKPRDPKPHKPTGRIQIPPARKRTHHDDER